MKTGFMKIRGAALKVLAGSLALLAVIAFVLPQMAQASTAYLTVIRNTATVNYNDTASSPMPAETSTVDITVAYQCATPTLNAPADAYTQPGSGANYAYTLTSNSNGPDTYNLTVSAFSESAGISGSTVGFWQGATSITSVTLGATTVATGTTITAAGTTAISVPNDGASDSSVNGIEAGDIIVIGTAVYAVASIADNGGTVGTTSTITVTGNGTAQVITAGTLINERQAFTTRVYPGTVTASANQTITVTTRAIGTTACGAVTDTTITTVYVATLSIVKEVSPDGTNWYNTAGAPQFLPGATVWYRITVTNNGSSDALAVTVTDPVPAYTTYVHQSTRLNGITVANDGVADPSPLIAGLLVDDNAARSAGVAATGILPTYTTGPAGQAIVIYRVTVN
jgi:uncharacterized repeat protein (TIGR01451 family)